MKKSVLLLAAALTMGAAQAENTLFQTITNLNVSNLPVPVLSAEQQEPNRAKALDAVTPEGTPFDCYMSYYLYGMDAYAYSDRPVQASQAPDGSAIYFGNLFPSFLSNDDPAWTKGEVQADGTILVRVQYIYNYANTYNLYAGGYDMATNTMHDISFKINADGSISQADPDELLMLAALDDEGNFQIAAVYQNHTLITAQPTGAAGEPVVVPETAVVEPFIYNYYDAYKNRKIEKGQVAVDGNDVYFCGITPHVENSWVKGTKEGNEVTIEAGQYLGFGAGYQLELQILKVAPDMSSYESTDKAVLTYDPETNSYSQVRESEDEPHYFFVEALTSGTIYLYHFDFKISYYPGDLPVKPAAPYNVKLYDFYAQDSRACIYFDNTNLGENGEYLEPSNLYYQVYMDDELYTFTPDSYVNLEEDMTLVPWALQDNKDFFVNSTNHFAYIYDLFESMGAQIVYFCDGQAIYSDIVTIDWDGNITTTEVNNDVTGIQQVAGQLGAQQWFDLQGHRLSKPQQGLNVVRVRQNDGSWKGYTTVVK